ncbi:MAG: hypothetical protein AAB834_07530 [Patescibacteria group bacterium]
MKLFDERGVSNWGRRVRILSEHRGEPEDIHARYRRIVAALGEHGTEVGHERKVVGAGVGARTIEASHSFVFPPQEDVVLRSKKGDGTVEDGITHEYKTGFVDTANVDGNLGITYGAVSEPPTLIVYDLIGDSIMSDAVRLSLDT